MSNIKKDPITELKKKVVPLTFNASPKKKISRKKWFAMIKEVRKTFENDNNFAGDISSAQG